MFYAFLFPTGANGYSALAFAASLLPIHVTAISPPSRAGGRLAVNIFAVCSRQQQKAAVSTLSHGGP